MYNHPNGETIYTHEGTCYTLEYEWYPADEGEAEFIEVRVLRGGGEVEVPPVLRVKMEGFALRDARLYECGLCRKTAVDPAPRLPPSTPRAGAGRAQIFSISSAGRR